MSEGQYDVLSEVRQLLAEDEDGEELHITYSVALTVNRKWGRQESLALTADEREAFEALALRVARRIGLIE